MELFRPLRPFLQSRMARNFMSLALAQVAGAMLGFAAVVYLARTLSLEVFGTFSFAQTLVAYLVLLTDLGIHVIGINQISLRPSRARALVSSLTSLRLLLALAVFGLFSGAILLLGKPAAWTAALIVFGSSVFAMALYLDWVFRGLQRMGIIGVAVLTKAVLFLVAVLVAVRGPTDLLATAVAWTGSSLAMSLVLGLVFLKTRGLAGPVVRPGFWVRTLRRAVPLGLSFLLLQAFQNLNVLLLGLTRPADRAEAEVALYSAAFRIVLFFIFIASSFGFALHPVLRRQRKGEDGGEDAVSATLESSFRFCLYLALPVAVGGFLLAQDLLVFVYGPAYEAAAGPFRVIVWLVLSVFVGVSFSQALLAYERGRLLLAAVAAGFFLHAAMGGVLVPLLGLPGASVSLLSAQALMDLLIVGLTLALVVRVSPWGAVARAVPAAAAMMAVLLVLDAHVLAEVAAGAGTYLAVLLFLEQVAGRLGPRPPDDGSPGGSPSQGGPSPSAERKLES